MTGEDTVRFALPGGRIMVHDYGDEVVVANLDTGWFYSLTGAHRTLWCALAGGWSVAEVRATLLDDTPALPDALDELLALVADAGLLVQAAAAAPLGALAGIAWQPGGIEAFDDLQDALLLDPVHEVGEAGWPYVASGD